MFDENVIKNFGGHEYVPIEVAESMVEHAWASMRSEAQRQTARADKLEREVEILRRYGNKDCTAMADAVLRGETCSGCIGITLHHTCGEEPKAILTSEGES